MMKLFMLLFSWLVAVKNKLSRRLVLPQDSGIFDPYLPLGRLEVKRSEQFLDEREEVATLSTELPPQSFWGFRLAMLVASILLSLRLIGLQITLGQENYSLAEGNRLKTEPILAPRGLIYDRNGVPLVRNTPSFAVVLRSADLPTVKADQQQLIEKLAAILTITPSQLTTQIQDQRHRDRLVLKEGLSREEALSYEIKLAGLPAIEIAKSPIRHYFNLPSLGHLIGYIGKPTIDDYRKQPEILPISLIGQSGLEKSYEDELRGRVGSETLEVDSLGRTIRLIGNQPPVIGNSLILSLDAELQRTAASSLKEAMDRSRAENGVALALNANTGEILAMVSLPDFDNNILSSAAPDDQKQALLTDRASPLINRAISGLYPPGSTVKPMVAVAALQEKVIAATTKLDTSEGRITIGTWVFHDWKVHGLADAPQAIAESNNIYFARVGERLGAQRLTHYLKRFGFGERSGIDVPGELSGLVPTPEWKKKHRRESWFLGDTYNLAIGQGDLLVTPLQLATATAAIANKGFLVRPQLVGKIITPNGSIKRVIEPSRRELGLDNQAITAAREGMRLAVTRGSARSLANLGIAVAAKTGTAHFDLAKKRSHAWFTAFAPYDHPEIVVTVFVAAGGEGYLTAAPVARNIIEHYFRLPLTPMTFLAPEPS